MSMYIGNAMLLVLNLPLIGLWVKVLKVPYPILFPLILLFCLVGVFSLNFSKVEAALMIGFGVFGYLARKFQFEMAPLVLALVIGLAVKKDHPVNTFKEFVEYAKKNPGKVNKRSRRRSSTRSPSPSSRPRWKPQVLCPR